jgi:hypothetical protein
MTLIFTLNIKDISYITSNICIWYPDICGKGQSLPGDFSSVNSGLRKSTKWLDK